MIWLHISGTVWGNQDLFNVTESQNIFYAINYYTMYWAVPGFIMITGSLHLSKTDLPLKQFYRKYLLRTLIVLFVFGYGYSLLMEYSELGRNPKVFLNAILDVFTFNTFSHMWYLYELIGIYLLLPFIKKVTDKLSLREFEVLLTVLFLFDYLLPFIGSIVREEIGFYIQISFSIFYLLLGYYLRKYRVIKTAICIFLAILALTAIGLIAYFNPNPRSDLINYHSPLVAVSSACIFCVFHNGELILNRIVHNRIVRWVEMYSFGIYLIHPLFIQILYRIFKITPDFFFGNCILGCGIIFFIVTALSLITSRIMKSIPVLKRII